MVLIAGSCILSPTIIRSSGVLLTHRGRDKMATILQITFPHSFRVWIKLYLIQISWKQSTEPSIIGLDNGLVPWPVTSHYLNQWWPSILMHLSFSLHELITLSSDGFSVYGRTSPLFSFYPSSWQYCGLVSSYPVSISQIDIPHNSLMRARYVVSSVAQSLIKVYKIAIKLCLTLLW